MQPELKAGSQVLGLGSHAQDCRLGEDSGGKGGQDQPQDRGSWLLQAGWAFPNWNPCGNWTPSSSLAFILEKQAPPAVLQPGLPLVFLTGFH